MRLATLLLFFATLASTQSGQVEPPVITPAEVQQWVLVWKKILDLGNWNISSAIVREMSLKKDTLGNIDWDADKKTAIIRVLDPRDYKNLTAKEIRGDIEFTIVHELIHLVLQPVLSPLRRDDANRRQEERAVNQMTESILRLHRASSQ